MYKFFIILFFFIFASVTFAQNEFLSISGKDSVRVDSITITGNDITEEFVILQELTFKEKDYITKTILDYNQERIFSLGLFSKVRLNIIEHDNFNEVNINVAESWYIYPLGFLTLRDKTIEKASYGVILLYKNFRGRNETIKGVVTLGYNPTYSLSYFTPNLYPGSKFMLGFGTKYSTIRNRSLLSENKFGEAFDYKVIFNTLELGYRLNLFNKISQLTSFEYYEVPGKVAAVTASKTKIDRIFSMGLEYTFDSRNLKQYSDDGIFGDVYYAHKGFGINNISYNVFAMDFRHYKILFDNLSAKWRALYRHTYGATIPFYELSLLGDRQNIRGHKFQRREGNNFILTSFELNYPLLKEWNLRLDLPLLPVQLTSARIAIYMNAFIDSGVTYNNNHPLAINRFDSGYGFGLTLLILPYNAFRFEYAFDEYGNGEFIIESGFSF